MSSKIVKLTEKQILDGFLKAFADSNLSIYKSDYYCGITDDLDRRAKEHNIEKAGKVSVVAEFRLRLYVL